MTTIAASFKHPTSVSRGYELEDDHALNPSQETDSTTATSSTRGGDATGYEVAAAAESSGPASGPLSEEPLDGLAAVAVDAAGKAHTRTKYHIVSKYKTYSFALRNPIG